MFFDCQNNKDNIPSVQPLSPIRVNLVYLRISPVSGIAQGKSIPVLCILIQKKDNMKKISLFAFSIILLFSCKKDAEEISPADANKTGGLHSNFMKTSRTARPFFISFNTSVDTNQNIPPTPCSGDIPGFANPGYFVHGTATHLGNFNGALSRGQDINCNISFATSLLTTSVEGEITSVSGDKIYYTGNDEINIYNLLTGSGNTGSITGVWNITGGTGKFADASGTFSISGPVNFLTGTFNVTGTGTIYY